MAYIDAFENARRQGPVHDLRRFAPAGHDPEYLSILCELARIDLEYCWTSGDRKELFAYQNDYPELFAEPTTKQALEFEFLRQQREAADLDSDPLGDQRDAGRLLSAKNAEMDACLPNVGETFGGFELEQQLGRGSFGRTFLARQPGLADRRVVLKLTTQELQEPQVLAQLQHPNIVPIYSVHRVGSVTGICMPYLGPTTLLDVVNGLRTTPEFPRSGIFLVSTIRNRQSTLVVEGHGSSTAAIDRVAGSIKSEDLITAPSPTDPPTSSSGWQSLERSDYTTAILWMFARLADGLHHAHLRGVLHQDVKPANILLSDDGRPLLIDFNLSRRHHDRESSAAFGHGAESGADVLVGGTLGYMAPERLRQLGTSSTSADIRSDIYSLGLTLRELLTGEPLPRVTSGPWEEQIEQLCEQRRVLAAPIAGRGTGLSPAIDAVLAKCLADDLNLRYQSAAELRDDLDRHLAYQPLKYAVERSLRERLWKWQRRHRMAVTIASLGVLVIAALLPMIAYARRNANHLSAARLDAAVLRTAEAYQSFLTQFDSWEASLTLAIGNMTELIAATQNVESGLSAMSQARRLAPPPTQTQRTDLNDLATQVAAAEGELALRLADAYLHLATIEPDQLARQKYLQSVRSWHTTSQAHFHETQLLTLQRQLADLQAIDKQASELAWQVPQPAEAVSAIDCGMLATRLIRQGSCGDALTLLDEGVRKAPNRYTNWLARGFAAYQLGRFDVALTSFAVCIALRPDIDRAYFYQGLTHLRLEEFYSAENDFTEFLQRSNHPDGLLNRGLARLKQNKTELALADFNQAIQTSPATPRSYLLRSHAYRSLGELSSAEGDRRAAFLHPPQDDRDWASLGFETMARSPRQSLCYFDQALQLNPLARESAQNKAHVLAELLNEPEAAIVVLDELLRKDSHYVPALGGRGVLHARLGNRAAAIADAEACRKLDKSPFTMYQLAGLYAQTSLQEARDREDAIALATLALQAAPDLVRLVPGDKDIQPLLTDRAFRKSIQAISRAHPP